MSFSFVQMPWATSKKEAQNIEEKKLDPVGQADADIDNDGDVDKSDKYLHNRRKSIKKAMDDEDPVAKKKKKGKSDTKDEPEGNNAETADMNPKVESIEFDDMLSLNEDSFDAYLDTLTYEELVELEEGIIGGTARLVGKGIGAIAKGAMAGAHRMTASGRADAAERKLAKVQKKKADIKRRETAQKKIDKLKGPSVMSKVGSAVGSAAKSVAKGVAGGVKSALSPEKKPLAAGTEPDSNKSNIREKLFAVVERKDHGRTDNSDDWDEKYTGKGAKKMRVDHNGPIDGSVDQRIKDTVKSGREGPTAKGRNGGDATRSGDQKIVQGGTPIKTSKENFSGTGHSLNGVMNAYANMYTEKVSSGTAQHGLEDHERKGHSSFMKKKHGVTTKYKGSDELSYHGSKKQVRGALDSHYGKGGDQEELHSHIYK